MRASALPLLQKYRVGEYAQPAALTRAEDISDTWTLDAQGLAGAVKAAHQTERMGLEPGVTALVMPRGRGELGARLEYGSIKIELAGESSTLAGTLDGATIALVSPRQRDVVEQINAAAPRWVVWADSGAIPRGLDAKIRAISLREAGTVEFVTDGKTLTVNVGR